MSKQLLYFTFIIVISMFLTGCAILGSPVLKNIQTVDQVNLEEYKGVWYEIASLPTWFANNLVCVTATYTLQDDGTIEVVNQGYQDTPEGKVDKITGTAWISDPEEPGQLKVSFFPLISSQYNIIALDEENYSYAMVTGKNYKFLWILSRTPQMDSVTYDMLIQQAEDWGYDVSKIEVTPQICSD